MQKHEFAGAIARCTALFIVLALTITYFFGTTYGWFSQNRDVESGNGSETYGGDLNITGAKINGVSVVVTDNQLDVKVAEINPGEVIKIEFDMDCLTDTLKTANFILKAPSGCELPTSATKEEEVNGVMQKVIRFYYLGSQIKISSLAFGPKITTSSLTQGLVNITTAPVGSTLVENGWGLTDKTQAQIADIPLYTASDIVRGSYTFTIELTFVDADFDQGVLKNFGKPDINGTINEVCSRLFFVDVPRNAPAPQP